MYRHALGVVLKYKWSQLLRLQKVPFLLLLLHLFILNSSRINLVFFAVQVVHLISKSYSYISLFQMIDLKYIVSNKYSLKYVLD